MKVDVPILSVHKYVRNGWEFGFDETGGYMKSKASGKTMHFIESDGAYWIKLKVHKPRIDEAMVSPVFTRPGNP